ncbi:MAG: nitronate monooxygenase [Bacteroidia bacterium]|nr:nitronate monooxygenase [Bacteroidia bacterium]
MKPNKFLSQTNIQFPLIMAPMFLVSNFKMVEAGINNGVMGTFPTLNFRKKGELADILQHLNEVKKNKSGSYGVNLIAQKTNLLFEEHLKVCADNKVPFYITSLGNPKPVAEAARSYGGIVYSDVTNLQHAEKALKSGANGFIAVGQGAGGHAGPNPLHLLVPALKKTFPDIPVIAAGGIATGLAMLSILALGAEGVSVGTRFIASNEASVNNEYKNSMVHSGMDDIVMTTRLSGTPCSIVNTPYAQKIGLEQNTFEKWLSNNAYFRKWFKTLVQLRGMKKLENSIKPGNYQTLWSAGKSVEFINDVLSCKEIIERFKNEFEAERKKLISNWS